ncbi:MAG: hypothetical protein Ct9H90mP13_11600 [Pseudomonadota bacterium]|nr:MAG: hypothetical protein Ct9H90mP13_11600 [Pseudomonadota bacterium]
MPRKLYAFVLSALFVFSTSLLLKWKPLLYKRYCECSGAEVTVTHVPTGTTKTRTAKKMAYFLFLTC